MLNPHYDCPQTAVFLRRVAWEMSLLGGNLRHRDLLYYVDEVRLELGMKEYEKNKGGGPDFIARLERKVHIAKTTHGAGWTLESPHWKNPGAWRMLNAPTHGDVRQMAKGALDSKNETYASPNYVTTLSFRDATLPPLEVWLLQAGDVVPEELDQRHALYMFRSEREQPAPAETQLKKNKGRLYVGETFECKIRIPKHMKYWEPQWVVVFTLADRYYDASLSTDTRRVAESLLICFFDEVMDVLNTKRGHDVEPHFNYFQQGVGLATAAAAALVWLARQPQGSLRCPVKLPFKRSSLAGWRGGQSYLDL